jgi:hypothetical protein
MSRSSLRQAGYILAGIVAIACDSPPTGTTTADLSPVSGLEQAAAHAASRGDAQSANDITDAASALRNGIQPTDIEVYVGGEMGRYRALVIGSVEELSPGDTAIRRSLVAWSDAGGRTVATLDVSTLGDVGSFASEFEPATDPRSRATGTWIDYVRDSRWVATTGTAELALGAHGGSCYTDRIDNRCVLAKYRVSVDGLFRLHGASPDAGLPAKRIMTAAGAVNGVLISNLDGGPRTRGPGRTPERKPARTHDRERDRERREGSERGR